MQLASDFMVQGDLQTIPLTTAAGYAGNAFIIIHFKDGNPDMGRKTFQPELQEFSNEMSRRIVAEFRKWQFLLKPDTGSQPTDPSAELWDWKSDQIQHSRNAPLSLQINERKLCIISEPREEQDVIALFHELAGMDVIKGLEFLSTEYNQKYDGVFKTNYMESELWFDAEKQPLGINSTFELPRMSAPLVLEYKYDLDALIRDFSQEKKNPRDIDLVICWETGEEFRQNYYLHPYLIDQEGSTRNYFGATHALCPSHGQAPHCEVVILKDLMNYLIDSDREVANQRAKYFSD